MGAYKNSTQPVITGQLDIKELNNVPRPATEDGTLTFRRKE
jgi:hypothetical protein